MKFVNELGNEIEITAEVVYESYMGDVKFINYSVKGPKSWTTNQMTKKEIEVLIAILETQLELI